MTADAASLLKALDTVLGRIFCTTARDNILSNDLYNDQTMMRKGTPLKLHRPSACPRRAATTTTRKPMRNVHTLSTVARELVCARAQRGDDDLRLLQHFDVDSLPFQIAQPIQRSL